MRAERALSASSPQMWSQETVRKLLEAGANIGMKNHFEEVGQGHVNRVQDVGVMVLSNHNMFAF